MNVEPSRLESHLRFFLKKGFKPINCRDFRAGLDRRSVIFTFDDAYESALTYGLEVLERNKSVGTFYAVAGLVGSTSTWDSGKERPLAGWVSLRKAQAAGMEIGNHTVSHPRVADLTLEAQRQEWTQAQQILSGNEIQATTACYPYGSYNSESQSILQSQGYTAAVALGKRTASRNDDPFQLPRIVVAFSDGLPKLLYKMHLRPHLPR